MLPRQFPRSISLRLRALLNQKTLFDDNLFFLCLDWLMFGQFETQATMLHLEKKHHMCQCVSDFEGTSQHQVIENSQPQIPSKGSTRQEAHSKMAHGVHTTTKIEKEDTNKPCSDHQELPRFQRKVGSVVDCDCVR